MANIENNKKSFQSEGIDIRVKQKPIPEDVVLSRNIDVDVKSTARIFLHGDGKLYFKDNVIKNPIPLEKLKNIYDRIKVEDGELRFFNKELTSYVTLKQMSVEKLPYQKNNFITTIAICLLNKGLVVY